MINDEKCISKAKCKLRGLEQKDAPRMLEWMYDSGINQWYKYPFAEMTLEKTEKFIQSANDSECIRHYAIVNDEDEYCGTISLKNIDYENLCAEMAIVLRREYHGTGIAKEAALLLFEKAFDELSLHKVYLNVLSDNERAISFYKKIGMKEEGISKEAVRIQGIFRDLTWFGILDKEYRGTDERFCY